MRTETEISSEKSKRSSIYMFWALFSAVIIAIAGLIRGIEAAQPFASKFCLSFWYLTLSFLTLTFYRCKQGPKFVYPWLKKKEESDKYAFSWKQVLAIICGGASEFVTSTAVNMSFNAA